MFKYRLFFPVFILIIVFFSSCKSIRGAGVVYITDENTIGLLPPSAIGVPMESHQLLTGSFGSHDGFVAEAFLVADEEKLDITMISPSGQTICSILWDGKALSFSSSFVAASKIKAEYIVADMQMAFYDYAEVGKLISSARLLFRYKADGDKQNRSVYQGTSLVWSMERDGNSISVVNHLRGYRYDIEILQ